MKNIDKIKAIFEIVSAVNNEPYPMPGLPKSEILALFSSVNITPPPELVSLYEWHNGINYLNGFLHFYDLEAALESDRMYQGLKAEFPDFTWNSDWHTILTQNADIDICLDTKTLGLYEVIVEDGTALEIAHHYRHYLDAILFLLRSDQYIYDPDARHIDVRYNFWVKIEEKYNIKSIC